METRLTGNYQQRFCTVHFFFFFYLSVHTNKLADQFGELQRLVVRSAVTSYIYGDIYELICTHSRSSHIPPFLIKATTSYLTFTEVALPYGGRRVPSSITFYSSLKLSFQTVFLRFCCSSVFEQQCTKALCGDNLYLVISGVRVSLHYQLFK